MNLPNVFTIRAGETFETWKNFQSPIDLNLKKE